MSMDFELDLPKKEELDQDPFFEWLNRVVKTTDPVYWPHANYILEVYQAIKKGPVGEAS